jgi:dipeptidyl aminopeptidase/acylaminoacyl peptidase
MKRSLIVFLVTIAALGCGSTFSTVARAADKHPFGLDDTSALRGARAIAISPDGKQILYEVLWDGASGPVYKEEWHLIDVSGANDRKLDLPEHFNANGFTKDGKSLYGIMPVADVPQLAIVPLVSGQPTQILALPSGVRGAKISPDGTRFGVLADPREKDPLAKVHTVVENDQTSLYVVSANGVGGAWWCPKLTDITDAAWSPDGTQIAVVTQWQKIGHHDVHSFVNACSASGARQLAEIPNAAAGLAWVKSGKDLATISTKTPVLTPDHVWTIPVNGGEPSDRTADLKGSAMTLSGDALGNVWVEVHRGVYSEIDAFRDGKLEPAMKWPNGATQGLPVSADFSSSPDLQAVGVSDPTHSGAIAVARNGSLEKITHEGDELLANVALGDVKVVHWTAKDGTNLEGIVTFPADYTSGKKFRYLVLPHGGPEANDDLAFDVFSRLVAGLGFVVMQPEYRGSTGYGSDFLAAIYEHFGDRAYSDVDSATDFAVAQGWADPERLAIFGWSAGGFMTSWTVTQTHRYKAAVEGAGITDWMSFIPTSDIGQVDYDRTLQEKDPTPLLKFSAVMYADRVTTPLLILHGEADLRVPTFQGREYYVLLAERGKMVRMVTYPGSPHFPRLAEQRRDVMKEVGDWLNRYDP